jgi:hypothetical protein
MPTPTSVPTEETPVTSTDTADRLAADGYVPVNPFDVPPHPACICPEAVSADGAGGGHQWGCYLRGDLAALLGCDAILMLPGWESSHGARLELTVASAVGLRVWWSVPQREAVAA